MLRVIPKRLTPPLSAPNSKPVSTYLRKMYLALFQDLIAVGGQYDNIRYSYGNDDSRQKSMDFGRASKNTVKTEERGKLPAWAAKHRKYEGSRWELPEPQELAHPIAKVPAICITPPDGMKHEPLNYTCENPKYDGNDSRSISDDSHEEVDQPRCDIGREVDSKSALRTDTMEDIEELSCSPYHDVESLTKDYEDWLRLAQGAAREACGDDLAGSESGRAGPSMLAASHSCQELILWRPEPTTASRKASTSVGRRFSLNQPIVYPFRNKRNSV